MTKMTKNQNTHFLYNFRPRVGTHKYYCPFCSAFTCASLNALDLHISFNHSEKKIAQVNAEEVKEIEHKFTCPVVRCKRFFDTQKELNSHMLLLHKEIRYSCTHCHRIFTDKQVLVLHLKLVHQIEKSDMKLPIVNPNKELIGYVVTEANQKSMTNNQNSIVIQSSEIQSKEIQDIQMSEIQTSEIQKVPEKSIENIVLEDDDIIEQIDDMIEKIDNDDDISIIGMFIELLNFMSKSGKKKLNR